MWSRMSSPPPSLLRMFLSPKPHANPRRPFEVGSSTCSLSLAIPFMPRTRTRAVGFVSFELWWLWEFGAGVLLDVQVAATLRRLYD